MKKIMIASLGLKQQDRIQYVLNKRQADCLIILHSADNERDAKEIKDDIESKGEFQVSLEVVDPWDYHNVLQAILEAVYEQSEHEIAITFNPSLGTRVMSAALFFAAGFMDTIVHLVKEKKGEAVDVIDIYPIHRQKLTVPKKKLLRSLCDAGAKGYPSIIKLAHSVGMSRASGSEHVRYLEQWGYVSTSDTKSKQVHITPLGKTVLKLAERWKIERKK